jgi:hypothetical protein
MKMNLAENLATRPHVMEMVLEWSEQHEPKTYGNDEFVKVPVVIHSALCAAAMAGLQVAYELLAPGENK